MIPQPIRAVHNSSALISKPCWDSHPMSGFEAVRSCGKIDSILKTESECWMNLNDQFKVMNHSTLNIGYMPGMDELFGFTTRRPYYAIALVIQMKFTA